MVMDLMNLEDQIQSEKMKENHNEKFIIDAFSLQKKVSWGFRHLTLKENTHI